MAEHEEIELIEFSGIIIHIRVGTPDAKVAKHCLSEDGEFSSLTKISLATRHNFIIDAGGYIGTAAIAMAIMYPGAKIVTVEPSSENYKILEKNVAPFPNIFPIKAALVNSERQIKLLDRKTGFWGFTICEHPLDSPNSNLVEEVSGITILNIMKKFEKKGIDILKLDIEGGEIEILDNSQTWLPTCQILIAELHDRIISGCTRSFTNATRGRIVEVLGHEKFLARR